MPHVPDDGSQGIDVSPYGGDSALLAAGEPLGGTGNVSASRGLTRKLAIEIKGSLDDFANGNVKPEWKVDKTRFNPFQIDANGNVRQDKSSQVVLRSAKLLAVHNSFPVSLGIKVTGVPGETFTESGDAYADVVFPRQSWSGEKMLVESDVRSTEIFKERYEGWSDKNLRKKGVVNLPEETYRFVDMQHPLVDMIRENSHLLQSNINEAVLIDGKYVKVDNDVFDSCVHSLEKQLSNTLPIHNMDNFKVSVHKIGARNWTDPSDIVPPNHAEMNISAEMTKNHHCKVLMELKYSHI